MYLTDRQAIWHIARKFNDYFLRQYKVHLQIICLQKLPSLFLKPLVSRSVHSLSVGVYFPWLLLNHYLSICDRLVHFGFGFELSDQFSFALFYLFTMGISTRIILLEGLEYLFKTAYSFLRTVGLELLKLNENSYQYLKSFVSWNKLRFWRVLNGAT